VVPVILVARNTSANASDSSANGGACESGLLFVGHLSAAAQEDTDKKQHPNFRFFHFCHPWY
jgi:hypothetical protein